MTIYCVVVQNFELGGTVCINADDDYCTSSPCINGAECRSISGGFTCNPCPLNFTGIRCEFGTSYNVFPKFILILFQYSINYLLCTIIIILLYGKNSERKRCAKTCVK